MPNFHIITVNDQLVVDSRLIAEALGIEHESFIRTVKKYQDEIQEFGQFRFKNGTVSNSVGAKNQTVFCYLNEDQATYVMTLSRNTDQVRECKRNLVKAFSEAKKVIKEVIPSQSETIQMLTLQNEVLGKELSLRQLDNTMLTIHGKEVVLALRGYQDQVVKVETVVTEICDVQKGTSEKILTAKQLKSEVKKRTGFDIGSQTEFVKKLREAGRDDLIIPVDRKVTNEYVKPECLDEAISVFFANYRQTLIGE